MPKTSTPPCGAHDILRYDPDSGLFHWRIRTYGGGRVILPGDVAGSPNGSGYINLKIDGALYRAHRVAWYFMTGTWLPPSQDIDHINRDRADNRWHNLRLATRSENNHNKTRDYGGRSGVNGVHWAGGRTQKWEARLTFNRTLHILGQFEDFADAVAARRAAEIRYLGRNEVPDHLVPSAPLEEPVRRIKTGLTEAGKARRLEAIRKPRNLEGRYPGVRMNAKRDKWIAMIRAEGRQMFLGTFVTYDEAVAARKVAEAQHHN